MVNSQDSNEPVAWLTPRTVDSYMRPDLGYETCSKTDYAAFPVYTAPPQPLNLNDPAVHKRLAAQWGYTKQGEQDAEV